MSPAEEDKDNPVAWRKEPTWLEWDKPASLM